MIKGRPQILRCADASLQGISGFKFIAYLIVFCILLNSAAGVLRAGMMLSPPGANESSMAVDINKFPVAMDERLSILTAHEMRIVERGVNSFNGKRNDPQGSALFKQSAEIIRNYPTKIGAVISAVGVAMEKNSSRLGSSGSEDMKGKGIGQVVFFLRMIAVIEKLKIKAENFEDNLLDINDLAGAKYWYEEEGFTQDESVKAAEFTSFIREEVSKVVQRYGFFRMKYDDLCECMLRAITGEDVDPVLARYVSSPGMFLYQYGVYVMSNQEPNRKFVPPLHEMPTPEYWEKVILNIKVKTDVHPKDIAREYRRIFDSMKFLLADDLRAIDGLERNEAEAGAFEILIEDPVKTVEAMVKKISGYEWRRTLGIGYDEVYYNFDRPIKDLEFFMRRHLDGWMTIPASSWFRVWMKEGILASRSLHIDLDLLMNRERFGAMLALYSRRYRKLKRLNPGSSHEELILFMGMEMKLLEMLPPGISANGIYGVEPVDKRSSVKNEMLRISFLMYEFHRLYLGEINATGIGYGKSVPEGVPDFGIEIEKVERLTERYAKEAAEEKISEADIWETAFRSFISELNEILPPEKKLNFRADIRMVPHFLTLGRLSESDWDEYISKYLGRFALKPDKLKKITSTDSSN